MKYHLYRSKNDPNRAITIGQDDDGNFSIASGETVIENNKFESIEQIEELLNDKLEMIRMDQ